MRDWSGLELLVRRLGWWVLVGTLRLCAAERWSAADLWEWKWIEDARIAPDARSVAYVVRRIDKGLDRDCAELWVTGAAGGNPRVISQGCASERTPQWSLDSGRLAWISDRGDSAQIRVLDMAAGTARTVVDWPARAFELSWSPDGKFLAFSAEIPRKMEAAPWMPPGLIDRLPRPESQSHILVAPASGGTPRRISEDGSGFREPAWMPGGSSVLASDGSIWSLPVAGGTPRKLTPDPGLDFHPLPSPDGSRIAWLSTPAKPQSYVVRRLYVMNSDGTRARILAGALDRDVVSPQWSSDSRTVYFAADDRGSTYVYAARNDGTVRQATTARQRLRGLSLADDGQAATVRDGSHGLSEVITLAVDRQQEIRTVASVNGPLVGERQSGFAEEVHFESAGKSIQGWLIRPPDFEAKKQYPLLVDAQDAPRAMYGVEFHLRAQIAAARGWVVLCANPRGTPGYGEEFGSLLRTRFPGDDLDDLLRGVEAALAKGYVDPRRIGIAGGLTAAWAIGHTARFSRAVARRPIVDWAMAVAADPGGAQRALGWMGGMPWDDPEQYTRRSPIFFASAFQTPTLVIGEELDPQSQALYWALQQRKVESALVRFSTSKPSDRVLELEAALSWLSQ